MARLEELLADAADLDCESIVETQERQADLIVLGTRRTALGERLPHVSAYAVMSKASCPLLTIPDGTAIEDGRLGNGERQRAA